MSILVAHLCLLPSSVYNFSPKLLKINIGSVVTTLYMCLDTARFYLPTQPMIDHTLVIISTHEYKVHRPYGFNFHL